MNKPFDMELFLAGVLTGAHATRERHLRQAKAIQAAISDRWHRDNPWTWQRKHLLWFIKVELRDRADATYDYYRLTVILIAHRLGKPWFRPPALIRKRPKARGSPIGHQDFHKQRLSGTPKNHEMQAILLFRRLL